MARVTGLEPATSGVTGRHSNQLSYTRLFSNYRTGAWITVLFFASQARTATISEKYHNILLRTRTLWNDAKEALRICDEGSIRLG